MTFLVPVHHIPYSFFIPNNFDYDSNTIFNPSNTTYHIVISWNLSKVIPRNDIPQVSSMCLPVHKRNDLILLTPVAKLLPLLLSLKQAPLQTCIKREMMLWRRL
jgi:hypothetical protein